MRLVRVYETDDGKQFDSRKDATIHELQISAQKKLSDLLKVSLKTGRPESVIKEMVEEAPAVRDILLQMMIRMPKSKAS